MKTTVWSLAMALLITLPVLGQDYDDELYYVPSAKKARSSKTVEHTSVNPQEQRQVVTPSYQNENSYQDEIDVDAYNRRYDLLPEEDTLAWEENLNMRSAVETTSNPRSYAYDAGSDEDDYKYTTAIVRFNNPSLIVYLDSPYYWDTGWGWGGYYNGWYSPGWSFSWNWGWGVPYYPPYYGPYYGWRPNYWHRPYYGWAPVYRNVSQRPDRNYAFGRNTRGFGGSANRNGTYNGRNERGTGNRGFTTSPNRGANVTTGGSARPQQGTSSNRGFGTRNSGTTSTPQRPQGTQPSTSTNRGFGNRNSGNTSTPQRPQTRPAREATIPSENRQRPATTTERPSRTTPTRETTPARVSTPSRSPSMSSPSGGSSSRGSFGGGSSGGGSRGFGGRR